MTTTQPPPSTITARPAPNSAACTAPLLMLGTMSFALHTEGAVAQRTLDTAADINVRVTVLDPADVAGR